MKFRYLTDSYCLPRALLSVLLLLSCLVVTTPSYGATGSSMPSYADSILRIPRIDVEGFGSLDLSLLLIDEAALKFSIQSSTDADSSLEPGATFNLESNVLTIPEVKVGEEFYRVEMLLTGETLQLTVADLIVLVGQQDYQQQCSSCHGDNGLGGSVPISLANCANCSSIDALL